MEILGCIFAPVPTRVLGEVQRRDGAFGVRGQKSAVSDRHRDRPHQTADASRRQEQFWQKLVPQSVSAASPKR